MTEAVARQEGARVIDKTVGNYLIEYSHGETELVARNPTNEMLYEKGMYEFLHGEDNDIRVLDIESESYVAVAPTSEDDVYSIWFGDSNRPVVTDPDRSYEVLEAINEAVEGDGQKLKDEYHLVFDEQARPDMVNRLLGFFDEVSVTEHGWKIDDSFLVTWKAEVYQSVEHIENDSFVRSGSRVVEASSRQAINLTTSVSNEHFDGKFLDVGDSDLSLTKHEIRFLSKVVWLVQRRDMLDDDGFWSQYE